MRAASRNLIAIRDPIAAAFQILPGKTPNHGSDVDARAKRLFIDPDPCHPRKEPLAGGVRKRPLRIDLMRPRRLPDEHHARVRDGPHHRPPENVRTGSACGQHRHVMRKSSVLYHRVRP